MVKRIGRRTNKNCKWHVVYAKLRGYTGDRRHGTPRNVKRHAVISTAAMREAREVCQWPGGELPVRAQPHVSSIGMPVSFSS